MQARYPQGELAVVLPPRRISIVIVRPVAIKGLARARDLVCSDEADEDCCCRAMIHRVFVVIIERVGR
jgi:hypothetical protein